MNLGILWKNTMDGQAGPTCKEQRLTESSTLFRLPDQAGAGCGNRFCERPGGFHNPVPERHGSLMDRGLLFAGVRRFSGRCAQAGRMAMLK
jgi:hypothetical protein